MVGPGNSIGTLTVAGNYVQASGSTYQLELTSTGQSDRINTSGAAMIADGAVLAVTKTDAAAYVLGTRYIVLTAAYFLPVLCPGSTAPRRHNLILQTQFQTSPVASKNN